MAFTQSWPGSRRSQIHVTAEQDRANTQNREPAGRPSIDVDASLIASVITRPGSRYALGVLNGSVTPNSAYYIAPILLRTTLVS